jgi:hypothetical protein
MPVGNEFIGREFLQYGPVGLLVGTTAAAVCHFLTLEALWISDSVYCHSCSVFISMLWSLQFS